MGFFQSFTSKVKTHFPILKKKEIIIIIIIIQTSLVQPSWPKDLAVNLATKQTPLKYFRLEQQKLGLTGLRFKPVTTDQAHCVLYSFFLQIQVLPLAPSSTHHPLVQNSVLKSTGVYKRYTKDISKLRLETSKEYT